MCEYFIKIYGDCPPPTHLQVYETSNVASIDELKLSELYEYNNRYVGKLENSNATRTVLNPNDPDNRTTMQILVVEFNLYDIPKTQFKIAQLKKLIKLGQLSQIVPKTGNYVVYNDKMCKITRVNNTGTLIDISLLCDDGVYHIDVNGQEILAGGKRQKRTRKNKKSKLQKKSKKSSRRRSRK
jgi:hypothetical protein